MIRETQSTGIIAEASSRADMDGGSRADIDEDGGWITTHSTLVSTGSTMLSTSSTKQQNQ